MADEFNIAGKDWLKEDEAAFYCGVSLAQFRNGYPQLGIVPRRFMGKKLYSKADLYAAIERSDPWHAADKVGQVIPGQGSAHERITKFCETLRKAKTQEERDALLDSLGPAATSTSPLDAYRRRANRK
jgi:hypothetical protein